MMHGDWAPPQEDVWTNLRSDSGVEQEGIGEALDKMDGSGVDDVMKQTSALFLSDAYKEVWVHAVWTWFANEWKIQM